MTRSIIIAAFAAALVPLAPAQDLPPDLLLDTIADPFATPTDASRAVALADLNGDTFLDLVVANQDQDNAVYFNDGSGAFTEQNSGVVGDIVSDGGNSRGVALADVDDDGDVDVFFANSLGQTNFLYLNQGGTQGGTEGAFVRVTTGAVATDTFNSRNACFADVDGDGDLDLFVANFNDQPNSLYLNDGTGTFTASLVAPFTTDGGVSYDCDFGDIDNDGDLDLFVSNHDGMPPPSTGSVNFLYLNQGGAQAGTEGDFVRSTAAGITTDVANSLCAAFADVDGDGDLDLFVANDESQDNDLYLGDGTGAFTADTTSPVVTQRGESISCAWSDVDDDGDPDLLVGNRANGQNKLYLNQGGEFRLQAFGGIVDTNADTYGIAAGDVDGNGLPDLFVANFGDGSGETNSYYSNQGPQWTDQANALAGVNGMPMLNATGNLIATQNVSLDIENAAPNATAAMIIGNTIALLPLKGGVLVPNPAIVIDGVSTDASGSLSLGGSMPQGIQGDVELIFQAWIVDPGAINGFSATNGVSVITPGI